MTHDDEMRARYLKVIEATIISEAMLFPRIHGELVDGSDRTGSNVEALREHLRHAVTNVPAYRGMQVDFTLTDEAGLVSHFPMIGKADLRDRFIDFCDDNIVPSECRFGTTSGTTGVPLRVILGFDHLVHEAVSSLRRSLALGLPLRRRLLLPMKTMPMPWTEYCSPMRYHSIVAEFGTDLSADPVRTVNYAQNFGPDVIYGHPSDCVEFANLVTAQSGLLRPRVIATYGEHLSESTRQFLSDTFGGALVNDAYAMFEFGTIASQCTQGTYHVANDKLFIEIIDYEGSAPVAQGQPGEIVITGFSNPTMPLIRYRTGDLGKLGVNNCSCGQRGQVIDEVVGRDAGFTDLIDGTQARIDGLVRIVRRAPVLRYQIVRHSGRLFELLVLPMPGVTLSHLDPVQAALESALPGATVKARLVQSPEFVGGRRRKDVDFIDLEATATQT